MQSKAQDIVRLFKSGTSRTVIARFLGVSMDYVKRVLYLKGLTKQNLSAEECDLIEVMAKRGTSRGDIANTFGVNVATVSRILRRRGFSMRRGRAAAKPRTHRWDFPKK